MAWHFNPFTHTPGEPSAIVGYLRKWSYSSGVGDWWDDTNQLFASAPAQADVEVAMAEDPAAKGLYFGSTSTDLTNTYTGHILEVIRDQTTDEALGSTAVPNPKIFYCRNGIKQSSVEALTVLSPDTIGPPRLWTARHDFVECREIVECTTSDIAAYAMDFSKAFNEGTSISSVSSVSDISGNSLTTSGLTLSKDKTQAHFTVTGSDLTANLTYQMKVTVVTTDGDTFARVGILKCVS